MTWISSARLNNRLQGTKAAGVTWHMSGPPRPMSDRQGRPEVSPGSTTGNGRGIQHGLMVVDDMFRLIAVDSGAASILTGGSSGTDVGALPARVPEFLKAASASNVPIRIGSQPYLCRTFDLRDIGDGGAGAPAAAIYLQRDISIDDFIDNVATECHLTERERTAVQGVVMGLSSKEIATEMKIAPNTVKSFLRTVMIKMGVSTRAAIVRKVLQFDKDGL